MAAFHARGTVRALRRAAGRQFPGKPLVAITTGVAAAASLSIGLASAIGAPPPPPADPALGHGKRLSNARLRATGWAPTRPSYREGYAQASTPL